MTEVFNEFCANSPYILAGILFGVLYSRTMNRIEKQEREDNRNDLDTNTQ